MRWPGLADRQPDLFVVTEFIAPDVLFTTANIGAPKKLRGYLVRCPS